MPYQKNEYILGCDIDNTLVPTMECGESESQRMASYMALEVLAKAVSMQPGIVGFGSVTGRSLEAQQTYQAEIPSFGVAVEAMDFAITSVGAVLHRKNNGAFELDTQWPPVCDWPSSEVQNVLQNRSEITLQEPSAQNKNKVSYYVDGVSDSSHNSYVTEIQHQLEAHDLGAQVIFSSGLYLDILPKGVNKGTAFSYFASTFRASEMPRPRLAVAGDSMNDEDLMLAADYVIMPSNAQPSLKEWAQDNIFRKTYFASQPYAIGILDGLAYAGII